VARAVVISRSCGTSGCRKCHMNAPERPQPPPERAGTKVRRCR
jgi:hypothetical protein